MPDGVTLFEPQKMHTRCESIDLHAMRDPIDTFNLLQPAIGAVQCEIGTVRKSISIDHHMIVRRVREHAPIADR